MFHKQSSLGVIHNNSSRNSRTTAMGYMAVGKVLKVHHKRNTADVQLISTNDIISSVEENEGRYSCRIGVGNAGYDEKYKKPYGEIIPLQVGSLVLVAFLENLKEKPIIIATFHETSEDIGEANSKNILPSIYPIKDEKEIYRYTNITRIQDFITLSGNGNLELSSHTKSFLVGINEKDFDEEVFDYEDLSIKDRKRKTVSVGEKFSKPMKWLAVFRSHYIDEFTNWIRIFIDSVKSTFRISRQNQIENKLSFIEIDEKGEFRIRIQTNSFKASEGRDYVELEFSQQGMLRVKKSVGGVVKSYIVKTEEEV